MDPYLTIAACCLYGVLYCAATIAIEIVTRRWSDAPAPRHQQLLDLPGDSNA